MTSSKYIYTPTRADQRRARQVLADMRPDEPSAALDDIAAGPLGGMVRFLAGAGLTFLLIAFQDRRRQAIGSPSPDLVATLGLRLLGVVRGELLASAAYGPECDPATLLDAPDRAYWKLVAMEQLVDALHERELQFVFGWQPPGEREHHFDYTLGAAREKVDAQLRWYLVDALGVDVLALAEPGNQTEVHHGDVR
ncbi:MAG: hypothetical protein RIC55_19200 [Pirellulaceae bacterium]